MEKKFVIVKTDSQKDGIFYHIMEEKEAEKTVYKWNSFKGGTACYSNIEQDVTNDIKKIIAEHHDL